MGLLWFVYFQDSALVFPWQTLQQLEPIEDIARSFSVGAFEINVPSTSLVVFESLVGAGYHPVNFFYYFFLVCLASGVLTMLAVISTLKRFSFLLA